MENFNSNNTPSLYEQLIGAVHEHNNPMFPILETPGSTPNRVVGPYRISNDLGEGSFSAVKLAMYSDDFPSGPVALKMIPLSSILVSEEDNKPSRLCKNLFMETWILSHLPNSEFFPHFHGLIFTNTHFIIVLQAITEGIELFDYLSQKGPIDDEADAKGIMACISKAVNLLHSMGIVHRDLKLENIFLVPDSSSKAIGIKLVDFGLATWLPLENCTEIISFELRRKWNEHLVSFWELISECGRVHSFLHSGDALVLLKDQRDLNTPDSMVPADLKPNVNILLTMLTTPTPLFSIYQSNIALYEKTKLMQRCGSEEYAPPELLLNTSSPYSGQLAESWSLGIIFYAIFTGKFPFQYNSALSYRSTVAKGIIEWSYKNFPSQTAKSLIEKLLTVSPPERTTVHTLVHDPWFN